MSLRLDSVVRAELQQPMADSPEEEEEEEEDEEEEEEAMEMESDEAEGGNSVLTICEDQAQIGKDGGTGTNMQQVKNFNLAT